MRTKWILNQAETIPAEVLGIVKNEFLAKLLVQRGINTHKKTQDFLNPLKMQIIPPSVFCNMQKSVERITKAIETQEKIIIWGDFDADGVTSTALMYKTLKFLGANVDFYIPSREFENHGLNTKALIKLISQKKMKLVITVDCGVGDVEEVRFLNGFKVDTIITDHHDYAGELPEAYAIINPKVQDNLSEKCTVEEIQYLSYLAGVGVAFKLACALLDKYGKNEFIDEILPFVALGTIADVVPLLGENRCFVTCGLTLIQKGKHAGLKKLLETAGYNPEAELTSENIAFGIAPRINAAGRLDTVDSAIKLLISDNSSEIEICCEQLNNLNKIRQELCDTTYQEAIEQLQNNPQNSCVVLFSESWHIGIIGIVASKLVEDFNKPVFMMTKSDDEPNIVRCSARGIEGLNLYDIIKANEKLFENFGGHKLAAGLGFDVNKVSIAQVRKALNDTVKEMAEGLDLNLQKNIDLEIKADELNFKLLELINQLQPFGEGNNSPLFVINDMTLKQFRIIGTNKNHAKLMLEQGNQQLEAVWWNNNEQPVKVDEKLDVAFYPKINEFNGKTTIQLDIQDLHFEGQEIQKVSENSSGIKIYDHRKKTDIFRQVANYCAESNQKILIFAEDKNIIEKLCKFSEFKDKLCTRMNVQKADQIMFFDYPANEELLKEIIKEVKPSKIHFMSYSLSKFDLDEILKTFSGMLKYAHNNKSGNINITQLSSIFGLTNNFLEMALELFASIEIIKIQSGSDENSCVIEFLQPKELNTIKAHPLYEDLTLELDEVRQFHNQLLTNDLADIETLVQDNLLVNI